MYAFIHKYRTKQLNTIPANKFSLPAVHAHIYFNLVTILSFSGDQLVDLLSRLAQVKRFPGEAHAESRKISSACEKDLQQNP